MGRQLPPIPEEGQVGRRQGQEAGGRGRNQKQETGARGKRQKPGARSRGYFTSRTGMCGTLTCMLRFNPKGKVTQPLLY